LNVGNISFWSGGHVIDNQSVVANVMLPSSCLKKKHNSIAYHEVREAIAAKVIVIAHVCGTNNIADIATNALGAAVVWVWYLTDP
jgi:hypothetical protein